MGGRLKRLSEAAEAIDVDGLNDAVLAPKAAVHRHRGAARRRCDIAHAERLGAASPQQIECSAKDGALLFKSS